MNGILGTTLEAIYQPARAGGVRDSAADVSKAAALLGDVPTVSFEEGLARTIEWCRTESAATAGR